MKKVVIVFNVLMLLWLVFGVFGNCNDMGSQSEAEQAGAAIGTALGAGLLMFFWAAGDIILGIIYLVTRKNKR